MKIFVLILSIYFLALPCLACAGDDYCTDEVQSSITKADADNHNDHEEDDCGSFCTCSCCVHVVTVNLQLPKTVTDRPVATNKISFIYDNVNLPSNYFGNIWQPPKIC